MSRRLFKSIKAGLEEILLYKQGKITLRTEIIEISEPPAEYKAKEIKKIRGKYSQRARILYGKK